MINLRLVKSPTGIRLDHGLGLTTNPVLWDMVCLLPDSESDDPHQTWRTYDANPQPYEVGLGHASVAGCTTSKDLYYALISHKIAMAQRVPLALNWIETQVSSPWSIQCRYCASTSETVTFEFYLFNIVFSFDDDAEAASFALRFA